MRMLTFNMKRKINTLRDILVGKIPDPKSQVEQITIAMVFKFMDDMDKEFLEDEFFGGTRKFFVDTDQDKYSKYAWTNLMNPQVSGQERADLYREGIEKMYRNPNLPDFFRELFRNAYIPFRDSETINLFLKEIDDFSYDNSEDLGEAFEMLLSIMSSQGDAGQFRTPRHIIDMIVDIVQPTKNDRILDPACGTAGFLISAYKFILNHNRDAEGNINLTPDEKIKLTQNIEGYDISQDMVRFSRVNMYLHHFQNPKVYEYDTLTSLDRWEDQFDVILANPPFMTPKGGINPHNRFRIKAKRSEVLFVDYIAEHLAPGGRAGMIVPEGIVFQSQSAYKELRKFLIDDHYLYAVISLPTGVFNPYSGVKTSILLFDKTVSSLTDQILFVRIENDGYDLGAQRREIPGSEIHRTVELVNEYKKAILEERKFTLTEAQRSYAVIAKKEQIAEESYVIVGERYKKRNEHQSRYPMVSLGDARYFRIESGGTPSSAKSEYWDGNIKWATLVDLPADNFITRLYDTQRHITEAGLKNSSAKLLPKGTILVSTRATIGRIAIAEDEIATNQGFKNIIVVDKENILPEYVAIAVSKLVEQMVAMASGGTFKEISKTNFSSLSIPLPPIAVQEHIIDEIESYQRVINGARQVIENYRPSVKHKSSWTLVDIGDIYNIEYGIAVSIPQNIDEHGIKIISTAEVGLDGSLNLSNVRSISMDDSYRRFILTPNTLLFNWRNAPNHVGKTAIFTEHDDEYIYASFLLALTPKKSNTVNARYVWYALNKLRQEGYFSRNSRQAVNQTNFNADMLKRTKIYLPELDEQNAIALQIEKELTIVKNNRYLIEIFEQKIIDKINELWGENGEERHERTIYFPVESSSDIKYAARNCSQKFVDTIKEHQESDQYE